MKVVPGISTVVLNTIASYLVGKGDYCLQTADPIEYKKYNLLQGQIGIGDILSIWGAIVLAEIRKVR